MACITRQHRRIASVGLPAIANTEERDMSKSTDRLRRARDFIYANARRVERARFEVMFEGAPAERLITALAAYRNDDGGIGHALEPDLRTPASQPLHTEFALIALMSSGISHRDFADDCCRFIAGLTPTDVALPAFLPGALEYPAAPHWQAGFGGTPTLDRTLGMVALLAWHGARHAWLDRATAQCMLYLADARIDEAHHLRYAFMFASVVLSGAIRANALKRLRAMLDGAGFYVAETPVERYGVTPLQFAATPDEPARAVFGDALLELHLDDLVAAQLDDGGWPIYFQPASEGAAIEWRGIWTLDALATLRAWRRI
jgi:hypothetical protein